MKNQEENQHLKYIKKSIQCAEYGLNNKIGGPFGAVIVKDTKLISEGWNTVTTDNDPTAHAEVNAIRKACKALNSFKLNGCIIYVNAEPCPMCLSAIYWARIDKVFYAGTRHDVAKIDFDDSFIYDEINKPIDKRKIPMEQIGRELCLEGLDKWSQLVEKIDY